MAGSEVPKLEEVEVTMPNGVVTTFQLTPEDAKKYREQYETKKAPPAKNKARST